MHTHLAFASSFLLAAAGAVSTALAQQYVISTYAGGAPPLPSPAPALEVPIGAPRGMAADAAGNVYFASLNCVFKLDEHRTLTRVAGNSRPGHSGDGGPAIAAQLSMFSDDDDAFVNPGGLTIDRMGNLYIVETPGNRVRKVSANGIITTVAGNGTAGYSGDGGPAISAQLAFPYGLAVDSVGDLYIADAGNGRVRKVSANGIITTIAGSGGYGYSGDGGPATSALLGYPWGVAADSVGNLYITEAGNARIRKVDQSGIITTIAGSGGSGYSGDGGPAASAELNRPAALAVDTAGNIYFSGADFDASVRKVDTSGIIIKVAAGGTGGLSIGADGNLYIADFVAYRIRTVSPAGVISTVAGNGEYLIHSDSGDGGPATSARLAYPRELAVDSSGNLYIADFVNSRVRKVAPNGVISTVAGNGVRGSLGDLGPATSAQLNYPRALAVDSAGNLYIAGNDYRVRRVSPNGIIRTVAGNGTEGSRGDGGPATSAQIVPISLAADSDGNLYIATQDYSKAAPPRFEPDSRVRKVSPAGIITTVAGNGMPGYSGDGGLATSAQLYTGPLAVDSAGDLYILGYGLLGEISRAIRKISSDGIITTVATIANGNCETSLAVDRSSSLYFTEPCQGRIRKVSPGGMITTIAGNPARQIGFPAGVAVDGAGNLYVADPWDAVVRILQPANRSVVIDAVVDAASQRADPVSPGKIVVIYGAGLGPSQLSAEPAGTEVSFNGLAATILYTSATQVAAVAPIAVTGTSAQVTVTYRGEASDAFTVPVAASAPSLFTLNQAGWGQAVAIHADGTPNTAANPVRIGEFVSLYATGEGRTEASTPPRPVLPVAVTVGGIPATIQYAGGAPGQVAGLLQVNVQIPSGVQPGGYVPVVLQVGDRASSSAVWIAVRN